VAPEVLAERVERLRDDLETGRWDARRGHLRSMTEADSATSSSSPAAERLQRRTGELDHSLSKFRRRWHDGTSSTA